MLCGFGRAVEGVRFCKSVHGGNFLTDFLEISTLRSYVPYFSVDIFEVELKSRVKWEGQRSWRTVVSAYRILPDGERMRLARFFCPNVDLALISCSVWVKQWLHPGVCGPYLGL